MYLITLTMARRSKITRMDKWDDPASRPRLKSGSIPLCDLSPRPALHQLGSRVYFSQFRRTKKGIPFSEIKQSADIAKEFADAACKFIMQLVRNTDGWAIITTPRRRHAEGFHFATAVCEIISSRLGIRFYADAVQCINRNRLAPEFHLLRLIPERRVIVYDDIITTGITLTATTSLLDDRDFVLNLIGINNR